MKEIKFRAWDKETNKMYPVNSIHSNGDIHIIVYLTKSAEYKRVGEFELQQFTGLKDKNGKEIYEGDIIKFRNDSPKVVEWSHHMWKWVSFNDEEEVIGNIFENPELIN